MTRKQIAEAFSGGDLESTYPFITDNTEWNVIGEFHLKGRESIIDKCDQTTKYFNSVTTNFKTLNVIEDKKRIAINGTAEFIRNDKRVAFVSACDMYEFDDSNKLIKITSYCIQEK